MKAIVATRYGSADVLQLQEVPKPAPKDDEIVVRVHATTVNVGDYRMRSFDVPAVVWLPARLTLGLTKPKQPIFGMELAGEVEAIGKAVTRFKPGDRVFAGTLKHNFGAHAEYKCLPQDGAVAIQPQNMTHAQAATLPVGAFTALHFLQAAKIQPGQKALIYGASGAVGLFAVQLARALGAKVTGVTSTRNLDTVQSLGAERVIDYTKTDFTQSSETYDVIFDAVGKTSFARCNRLLKAGGTYLSTVFAEGPLAKLWYTRTTGKGIVGETAVPSGDRLRELTALVEAGHVIPVIDRCYPLAQMAEAHRYVETGKKVGSVVVEVR